MYKFIILAISLVLVSSAGDEKLSIGIYYESLCPDSIRFITNQLYPAYNSIRDYVDILFVPFGKSESVNGGESFICQHGPDECTGNRIQSCVLHQLEGKPDAQMDFVACQMQFGAELSGYPCTSIVGANHDEVLECYSSDLGRNLQLQAEELTRVISPSFVPTMVYNEVFNQELQDRSLYEFVKVVCEKINHVAPVCQQTTTVQY